MVRAFITGRGQAISRTDFNTRVKRLVADMPDPKKATRNLKPSTRLPFRRLVKQTEDILYRFGMEDIAEHAQTHERTSGHFVKERVMVQPRLTGLEFSWFTKCQMMAANYAQHWGMSLEPALGNLVQNIAAEARTSFTGSPSMGRVAERLALASDAMTAAGGDRSARAEGEREETRCAEALLYLSTHLSRTATDVEAWKHASASTV